VKETQVRTSCNAK